MSNQGVREVVIAATYRTYQQHIHSQGKNPRQCIYVDRPELLDGLQDVAVVVVGEPWTNPVFRDPRIIKTEGGTYVLASSV